MQSKILYKCPVKAQAEQMDFESVSENITIFRSSRFLWSVTAQSSSAEGFCSTVHFAAAKTEEI